MEFYRSGQEGWVEDYDPRYSLAYVDTGTASEDRPSYVVHSSFHHGFSPAIGLFMSSSNITVDSNVIHHTVGEGKCNSSINCHHSVIPYLDDNSLINCFSRPLSHDNG